MSRLPVAGNEMEEAPEEKKVSTLSALMLRVEGDSNCPANASQYLE